MKAKATYGEDDQVLQALSRCEIEMPLWGVSLDRSVAESFGTRFTFVLEGPFHGIAAWEHSGELREQYEIIVGGRYKVVDLTTEGGTSTAVLQEMATVGPPADA